MPVNAVARTDTATSQMIELAVRYYVESAGWDACFHHVLGF